MQNFEKFRKDELINELKITKALLAVKEESIEEIINDAKSKTIMCIRMQQEITRLNELLRDEAEEKDRLRAENFAFNEKYQKVKEVIDEPVVIAEVDSGKVIDFNKSAQRILGKSTKEILGTKVQQLEEEPVELYKCTKAFVKIG